MLLTSLVGGAPPDVQARIARVESGLLARYAIDGQPGLKMTLAERMAFYKVPGVSIAVIHNGRIEWAKGYGVREAGQAAPVETDTLFQAASISKPVAAMAALRLVQEGRLSLDEDVNRKLTTWKVPENKFTAEQKVTLRRILTHSAGLTVHGFPGYARGAPLPTLAQVLDGVGPANTAPIRVDVKPGSLNRYSGGGFTLMQQMLIDVTGKPFPEFIEETVLGPLGMTQSTYQQPLPKSLWRQAASAHDGNGVVIQGRWHTYPEMAAAGLWTTPSDLARFAIELRNAFHGTSERVLSAATARQMLTRQRKDLNGLGIGLGGEGSTLSFSHGGANRGFMCHLIALAESGDGAAIMTNGDRGQALIQEVLRAIAAEYGWPQ
jgi:CubicO group peptidase (beta-lactamase class C family)